MLMSVVICSDITDSHNWVSKNVGNRQTSRQINRMHNQKLMHKIIMLLRSNYRDLQLSVNKQRVKWFADVILCSLFASAALRYEFESVFSVFPVLASTTLRRNITAFIAILIAFKRIQYTNGLTKLLSNTKKIAHV